VRRVALLLLAAAVLAGCGGDDEAALTTGTAATPSSGVKELTNVLDLRADFEADAGKPRVIVLLSPT
jgi:ABC-type glycerol-3-phosphate transport system substrate-binding protein